MPGPEPPTIWRNPRLWAVIVAVFCVLAALFTVRTYYHVLLLNRPGFTWALAMAGDLPFWLANLLTFPMVVWAVHRVPPQRSKLGRVLLFHVSMSLVYMVVQLFIGTSIAHPLVAMLGDDRGFAAAIRQVYLSAWADTLTWYWSIAAVVVAVDFGATIRQREQEAARAEIRAAQLETNLERARLDWLRSQLNPHFLFNTLNSISTLARQRRTEAVVTNLSRLADLLRATLSHSASMVPLKAELRLLEQYLDIERLRFGDRLTVTTRAEPGSLSAAVPSLILQPLVENAMKHGLGGRRGPVEITISARADGGVLELEVSDSGYGFSDDWNEGIGLSNTRSRLEQLYGADGQLVIESTPGNASVRLRIPCVEYEEPVASELPADPTPHAPRRAARTTP